MTPAERALLIALAKHVLRYVGAYRTLGTDEAALEDALKAVEKESQ